MLKFSVFNSVYSLRSTYLFITFINIRRLIELKYYISIVANHKSPAAKFFDSRLFLHRYHHPLLHRQNLYSSLRQILHRTMKHENIERYKWESQRFFLRFFHIYKLRKDSNCLRFEISAMFCKTLYIFRRYDMKLTLTLVLHSTSYQTYRVRTNSSQTLSRLSCS